MSLESVFNWLNLESPSNLSDNSRFWVNHFRSPGLADDERLDVINSLLQTLPGMQNPLEQAEVMTYSAVLFHQMRRLEETATWLERANQLYQYVNDVHRQAITSWMRYFAMRSLGSYAHAYEQSKRARRLMQERAEHYAMLNDAQRDSSYRSWVNEITVELISTPEDMFEWLFEFNAPRLNPAAAQVRDRLRMYIEREQFPQAEQEMQVLQEITRTACSCEETGEALAYCGIAEWVMENQMNALYFFRAALSQYLPASHEYAVLTWILGLAQYTFPHLRARSFASMQSAIDKIDRLRIEAIHQNQASQRDWYALHHIAMTRVLRQNIAGQP